MKLFGKSFEIISTRKMQERLREKEKTAYKLAFSHFADATKVLYGNQTVIIKSDLKGKLVLLGDNALISHNSINIEEDETPELSIN